MIVIICSNCCRLKAGKLESSSTSATMFMASSILTELLTAPLWKGNHQAKPKKKLELNVASVNAIML